MIDDAGLRHLVIQVVSLARAFADPGKDGDSAMELRDVVDQLHDDDRLAHTRTAERADPAVEDAYWRDNYASRPYVSQGTSYDEYAPAYRYGADSYSKYPDRSFDDIEPELSRDWVTARGKSSLEWEHAKHASRDAWHRLSNAVERAVPGDSDRDGR